MTKLSLAPTAVANMLTAQTGEAEATRYKRPSPEMVVTKTATNSRPILLRELWESRIISARKVYRIDTFGLAYSS